MAKPDVIDVAEIRTVMREVTGTDPGQVEPTDRLSELGLAGVDLLGCIAAMEDRFGVEFPAALVAAMETVDDLVYFTSVKRSQP